MKIYYKVGMFGNSLVLDTLEDAKLEVLELMVDDISDKEELDIKSELEGLKETKEEKVIYRRHEFYIKSELFTDKEIKELPEFNGW